MKKPPSGILLVDKPGGITSALVVRRLARLLGKPKCGHLGTLDPMATGLLVVCVGNATKLVPYYGSGRKSYLAEVTFGTRTSTDDAEGDVAATAPLPEDLQRSVDEALPRFVGTIKQVPPVFCAVKIKGRRLYKMARQGIDVEVPERTVTIYDLSAATTEQGTVALEVTCSAGTYIRSLARDLGQACGSEAHLSSLRRTMSTPFSIEGALPYERLMEDSAGAAQAIKPVETWLPDLTVVQLSEQEEVDIRFGRAIERAVETDQDVVLISPSGKLVAIGDAQKKPGWVRVKRLIDTH
jgi:tRNA pseudouridine55 synthase